VKKQIIGARSVPVFFLTLFGWDSAKLIPAHSPQAKRKRTCKTGEALCSQHDSTGLAAGKTAPSTNEQKAETKVSAFLF